MTRAPGVAAALVTLVLGMGAGGCASLPRSGPVQSVAIRDNTDAETLVDYTPSGPTRGMAPVALVENFLTSMTATPPNTYVAREFLTSGSSRSWVPERGTVVYGGQEIVSRRGGRVTLRLRDVVELDSRGAWRGDPTGGRGRAYRLRLVKEGGQWRISRPPDRLLIPRTHFDAQYQQYLLYFLDKTAQVLVPEPVFVPRGRQAPTLLVAALLKGPEPTLLDTERTFLPRGTALAGISVPVTRDGTAEVPLSDRVLTVDRDALRLVFAQLAWALGQLPGVRRLQVSVGGAPVELPGSSANVDVSGYSKFDPSVAWASAALFGVRDGRVVTLGSGGEVRVSGPLGSLTVGVRSVAVDLLAQRVAVVSSDGHRVYESPRDGVPGRAATRGDVRTVRSGAKNLLRPAYDLYGQLWIVDRAGSGARLWVARAGTSVPVRAPGLTGADVRRFVVSRDGSRLVTWVRRDGRDVLLVARVRRDDAGRVRSVGAPQRLASDGVTGPVRDIAWWSPTTLAVLYAPSADTSQVSLLPVDGSSASGEQTTDPEPFRGRATRLVSSPAPGTPAELQTPSGRLYTLSAGPKWTPSRIAPGLVSPTFVG